MSRDDFETYIANLYAPEDDVLRHIHASTEQHQMPNISINPQDGALLNLLVRSINANTVVEIGTLAGYSGTWIARALPDAGKLYTVEISSKHASVARDNFDRAGLSEKVEVVQGQSHEVLRKLQAKAPFDFVFIDANKDQYPYYLDWATENVRSGGMIAAHNAYRGGGVLAPKDENDQHMRDFLQKIADNPRLQGMILPLGDGMAIALKL